MMDNILWSEERGPFGCGLVMCKDAIYINTEHGSLRISGKDLKLKLLLEQMPVGQIVETGLRHKVEARRVTPWILI